MKKNKFEIVIIIGMLVFSGILFGLYLVYEVYLKYNSYSMILNPYTILECKLWKCKNVSDKLNDYNDKDYVVYIDGENKGINSVFYDKDFKKFYVFDKSYNNLYNTGKILILDDDRNVKQLKFNEEEVTAEELNELNSLSGFQLEFDDVVKVSYDFDSDGKMESLFTVNKRAIEEKSLSMLVYYDGKKYNVLDKEENADITEVSEGYVSNVINIFDDNKIEFIYTKEFFSNIGTCSVIYKLKGKKFVSVNDCEIVE